MPGEMVVSMKMLNLGCGVKTSDRPGVINIDWSIYLRIKRSRLFRVMGPLIFNGQRWDKFRSLPDNIMVYNLAKGIPFPSESIDVVYHSHMLEHLDRDVAVTFLHEIKRVLKPGGICRIVVPDLEKLAKLYVDHISACDSGVGQADEHDLYIAQLLEQSVRKEASGTRGQRPLRRWLENLLLGDARQRGETHQWMYDRVNLSSLLKKVGFTSVAVQDYKTSFVQGWQEFGLDVDEHGNEYKPGSLYVEAVK